MKTKTISEYNFTKATKTVNGNDLTLSVKLRINHQQGSYDICSTYHDEKFNFKNIRSLSLIDDLLELMKEANAFATNELLKIN
jgi:hypothetical protein